MLYFVHGEFAGRSPPHGRYEARRDGRSFESRRHYVPRFPPRGARSPLMRLERIPPFRGERFHQLRHGRVPAVSRERVPLGRYDGVDFTNHSFE